MHYVKRGTANFIFHWFSQLSDISTTPSTQTGFPLVQIQDEQPGINTLLSKVLRLSPRSPSAVPPPTSLTVLSPSRAFLLPVTKNRKRRPPST